MALEKGKTFMLLNENIFRNSIAYKSVISTENSLFSVILK